MSDSTGNDILKELLSFRKEIRQEISSLKLVDKAQEDRLIALEEDKIKRDEKLLQLQHSIRELTLCNDSIVREMTKLREKIDSQTQDIKDGVTKDLRADLLEMRTLVFERFNTIEKKLDQVGCIQKGSK